MARTKAPRSRPARAWGTSSPLPRTCAHHNASWRPHRGLYATRTRAGLRKQDMAQFAAADAQATPQQSRADRFLGIHLHQLHPHLPLSAPMATTLRPGRPRDYRGAYARVRVRQESQKRRGCGQALRLHLPDRGRQRLRYLERLPCRRMADGLPDRQGRQHRLRPQRRRRLRRDGTRNSDAAEGAQPEAHFASARYAITKDEEASMMGGICRRESPETYLGFLRGNNIANPGGEDRTMEV